MPDQERELDQHARVEAGALENERNGILRRLTLCLLLLLGIGLLALLISQRSGYWAAVGIGALVFIAALASGGALGFIFALPRVMSDSGVTAQAAVQAVQAVAAGEAGQQPRRPARLLQSNTNLERISDWLTTMLVGVSLTQLTNAPHLMLGFHAFLEQNARVFVSDKGVRSAGWLPMVGSTLLVFAALVGFIAVYLYMRLVLVRLFLQAEVDLTDGRRILTSTIDRRVRDQVRPSATLFEKSIVSRRKLSISDSLELMRLALFDEKRGYQRTIEIGAALMKTSAIDDPDFWVYLACAFGQKHHDLQFKQNRPETDPEVVSARANVLDCVGRAIAGGPEYVEWLRALTDEGENDNDLQDFVSDPAFLKLLKSAPRRKR